MCYNINVTGERYFYSPTKTRRSVYRSSVTGKTRKQDGGFLFRMMRMYSKHWVYILDSGLGIYKIGYSSNVQKRMENLQEGSPVKLTILHTIPVKSPGLYTRNLEKTLHELFEKERLHGEWFKFSKDQIEFILELDKDNWKDKLRVRNRDFYKELEML